MSDLRNTLRDAAALAGIDGDPIISASSLRVGRLGTRALAGASTGELLNEAHRLELKGQLGQVVSSSRAAARSGEHVAQATFWDPKQGEIVVSRARRKVRVEGTRRAPRAWTWLP